jgi:excisionase family DNA binding protein
MTDNTKLHRDDRHVLAVSPAEAARVTGLGRTTIYAAITDGSLASLKVGRRRLVRIAALEAWLRAQEVARG